MSDNKVVSIAVRSDRLQMENDRLLQFLSRDQELLNAAVQAIKTLQAEVIRYGSVLHQIATATDADGCDMNREDMMACAKAAIEPAEKETPAT